MAQKNITVQFDGQRRFIASNASGGTIVMDTAHPETHLTPMETLLGALGGCTGYDVVSIMEKKKQPLTSYRIEITGETVDDYPKRYQRIVVTHIASGPNVTLAALERAVQLSHEKYCSVSASLNAVIETKAVVEEK